MRLRKITLAPLLALTLSGCNDAIDTVKSSRMEINDQYTVDQAFSNRSLCESVDWDVITDDRNRELVQYKCRISGIESYYEREKQLTRENLLSGFETQRRAAQVHLESARLAVEDAENALKEPGSTFGTTLESERLSELLTLEALLKENPPSRSLLNFSSSPEVKEAASRYFMGYVPGYKQNERDLLQAMATERPKVQAAIEEERARLSEIQKTQAQKTAAYAQQRLNRATELYQNLQNSVAAKLEELDAQHAAKLKQFDGAATIESVAEVFEWVVKEEEIELIWSGLEGTYSDGSVKKFDHFDRLGSLRDVYRNTADTYSDLRQKAPLM